MRVRPVLTVDVEEWFHVCGVPRYADPAGWERLTPRVAPATEVVLDLLAGTGSRATFYVLGWVARRHPGLVQRIVRDGHELGCHGDLHRRVHELAPAAFRAEIRRAKAALEDASGRKVVAHRAPEWSIRTPGDPALRVLVEEGFETDSSLLAVPPLGPVSNPRRPTLLSTASGTILEVPALVGTFFGRPAMLGGGWTARLSREARVRAAIDAALASGVPPVLYVHPWEIDPLHPPMDLRPLPRFVHFAGRAGVTPRLGRFLGRYTFDTVAGAREAFLSRPPRVAA